MASRRSERIRQRKLSNAPERPSNNRLVPGARASRSGKVSSASALPQLIHRKADPKTQLHLRLSFWLDEMRQIIASGDETLDLNQSELDDSASQTSLATSENLSTVTTPTQKGKAKELSEEGLRTRRVDVDGPQIDDLTTEFKKYLVEKPIEIPFEATKELQSSFENFLSRAKNASAGENSYHTIEKLFDNINEWKANARLAAISNQDFDGDLEYCRYTANETIFQRTVMMSIINRSCLKEKFDFNCEGNWSQGTYPLPSTNGPDDIITGPNPDLAIFFKYGSLVGTDIISRSAAIPDDLKSCISPDNDQLRCFPFIFIETEKGFDNLKHAVLANMHSASQALFNIYAWMSRVGYDATFFNDVRLFSIAINVEKVVVRVHRARLVDSGDDIALVFSYDELYPRSKPHYTRDEVCTLIHNILLEYGEKKLLPILKKTVVSVLKWFKQDLERKGDAALHGRSVERLASVQPEAFGISGV